MTCFTELNRNAADTTMIFISVELVQSRKRTVSTKYSYDELDKKKHGLNQILNNNPILNKLLCFFTFKRFFFRSLNRFFLSSNAVLTF